MLSLKNEEELLKHVASVQQINNTTFINNESSTNLELPTQRLDEKQRFRSALRVKTTDLDGAKEKGRKELDTILSFQHKSFSNMAYEDPGELSFNLRQMPGFDKKLLKKI